MADPTFNHHARTSGDRSNLYRIESGRIKEPKLATRKKLAAALRVSERTLFGEK